MYQKINNTCIYNNRKKNVGIKFKMIVVLTLLSIMGQMANAQSPKREVRATWLTTVWRLDWPSTTVPEATGTNEAQREAARNVQKSSLISILDKLQAANFNTVLFQVRSMSDAFYNSQYEPWSQFISSVRGANPGWDPLAFAIEQAHARGIELHAWINPYRYSTSESSHGNLSNDYASAHPEWLLDYGNSSKILNPGLPIVRQRIADVVADILNKYNVDGIVFDDYFYQSGTTDAMDQQLFQQYNPNGLSRGDWRRNNVNQMIKDVQARINSIKPYVTFGVSPAGVAASDINVANKYGVEKSPVGSDWQYNSIYSDPLAWLKDGSIDYISPQLYWASGHATNDYSKLSPWWAKVSNFFGRNFYSSNTSTFTATELVNEVNINRDANLNSTTGSVYFRTNNIASATLNSLKANAYQGLSLGAAYGWKPAPVHGLVESLFLSGQNLSWNYNNSSVRYTIYAVPRTNLNETDIFTSSKYLLGVSYSTNFTLPTGISNASHVIAVAVYDRFGNEFPPRILGVAATTVNAAQLIYPQNNASNIVLPALFTWESGDSDVYYIWELAEDVAFTKPIATREVTSSEFNSGLQTNIKENTTYYWRVKTVKPNAPLATSEVRNFSGTRFKILTPENGQSNMSMTPEITWTSIGQTANYTLEISDKADFSNITYTTTVQNTSATVAPDVLNMSTTYYARVRVQSGGINAISERISFTTIEIPVPVPVLLTPVNETTVYGNEIQLSWQQQVSKGFRAELSQSNTFPTRSTTVKSVDAQTFTTSYSNLTDGTYYVRVRALNSEGFSNPSEVAKVYVINTTSVDNIKNSEKAYVYYDLMGNCNIVIETDKMSTSSFALYSSTGILLKTWTSELNGGKNTITPNFTTLGKGLFFVKIKTNANEYTLKIQR